jgi:hypothetical protein
MTTINHTEPAGATSVEAIPSLPHFEKQKLFTISMRCGRLANRLIIFANFVALAEEQGHNLTNFTFHSYSELFEGTQKNVYCRYPRPKHRSGMDVIPGVAAFLRKTRIPYHITRYTALLNERHPVFGNKVITLHEFPGPDYTLLEGPAYQEKIRPAKIVFVYGWWLRSPALMKKHGEKIRAYFRPVEKLVNAALAVVDPLRRVADILIGVHVRRGDYSYWKGGKYYFTAERYAAWMHDLVAQFPGRKVAFVICSDEPRRLDEFPGLTVGLGPDSPVSDVFALAQCDYILGPKSTFTQWASFYGNKPLLHLEGSDHVVKIEDFRICYLEWGS